MKTVRIVVPMLALTACVAVDETEWCVQTRYGKIITERMSNGINWSPIADVTCFPLTERMFPRDTTEGVTAQTQDPLTIVGDVSIVYAYDPSTFIEQVFKVKRNHETAEVEVLNAIRAGYRDAISSWTVQEIIDHRASLSDSVQSHIQRKLGTLATVKRAYVRDIRFPEAIEKARITAVQRAADLDAARKQLAIDSANATGQLITARAAAEAKRLESAAFAQNPRQFDLEIAKAWRPCGEATTCVIGGSSLDVGFLKGGRN